MKIILEMANNHMGSVLHGKKIIEDFAAVVREVGLAASFFVKFQYRDLDSYIHDDVKGNQDIAFVRRFESTRLSDQQFDELKSHAIRNSFKIACTPFDAPSAEKVIDEGFDLVKIASACIDDWEIHMKLVERIKLCDFNGEIVFSTGGASIDQIDRLASFYKKRTSLPLNILHCVASYPYNLTDANLHKIPILKNRYPFAEIGYSAHEKPNVTESGGLAYMVGARVFEKHVGVDTEEFKNNEYTIRPREFREWLLRLKEAELIFQNEGFNSAIERETVFSLKRGAVLKNKVSSGDEIGKEDIKYTFPRIEGQLGPEDFGIFSKIIEAASDVSIGDRVVPGKNICFARDQIEQINIEQTIAEYVHKVKGLLRLAGVTTKINVSNVELSHHYGLSKLSEYGALLITCINTELYSKKILVQTPGQKHPSHSHSEKDETFEVLYGTMYVQVGQSSDPVKLEVGDTFRVKQNTVHSFWTDSGVVFEEVATQAIRGDSYYKDNLSPKRKSKLDEYWHLF